MSVEGKVAVVTGGASGIGRASALLFAANGAKVVVADCNHQAGEVTRCEIAASGGTAVELAVDVANSKSVDRLVADSISAFGRIDILLHCAGICPRQPVLTCPTRTGVG